MCRAVGGVVDWTRSGVDRGVLAGSWEHRCGDQIRLTLTLGAIHHQITALTSNTPRDDHSAAVSPLNECFSPAASTVSRAARHCPPALSPVVSAAYSPDDRPQLRPLLAAAADQRGARRIHKIQCPDLLCASPRAWEKHPFLYTASLACSAGVGSSIRTSDYGSGKPDEPKGRKAKVQKGKD